MKVRTLTYNLNLLKHELKTASLRLNYLRKTNERKRINRQFTSKPKLCIICSVIQTLLLRKFLPAKKWNPTGLTYGKRKQTLITRHRGQNRYKMSIVET